MRSLWWSLPGPGQFLEQITNDLLDGKHVFIRVPDNGPKRLKAYLKENWLDNEMYEWRDLNLAHFANESSEPVKLLYDVFLPDLEPDNIRNVANLARNNDFGGKVIWLEGIEENNWPVWKKFLYDYSEVSRTMVPDERSRFVVYLCGKLAILEPYTSVLSSVRNWQGTVNQLDMILYCSSLLRGEIYSDIQKRLKAQLIANLSLWDQNLSDFLCDYPLEDLFEPVGLLLEFAEHVCWTSVTEKNWFMGNANDFEGRDQTHSAYLAVAGLELELRRRVWNAQLTVLYPAIEELRFKLIEYLGQSLTIPFDTGQGFVIDDRLDLEIGHIYHQMRSDADIDKELFNSVYRLRKMRNYLAHMDPVPKSEIDLVDNVSFLEKLLTEDTHDLL